MLFQGAALFDSLAVWENVAFRLINADGVARRQAKLRALEALDRVRLNREAAELYPSELSGGMQKRVGLARAMVANPEIIFFDEPTTGLDPVTGRAINALILEQVKSLGCTAVSITHDLDSARTHRRRDRHAERRRHRLARRRRRHRSFWAMTRWSSSFAATLRVPPTANMGGRQPFIDAWYHLSGSNRGPPDPQSGALTD